MKVQERRPSIPKKVMRPAIDPLTFKNKPLDEGTISKYLLKYNIPVDKPIILQVSRFINGKTRMVIIDVFKLVKQEVDSRLILLGNKAVV